MTFFAQNMVSDILQLWRTWQCKIMRTNGGSFESHLVFIPLKGPKSTAATTKKNKKERKNMNRKETPSVTP